MQDAGDFTSNDLEPLNTLDEPVWETIKRDLSRIGANLVLVVFPFKSWDQQSAALKNWDLWGPMVCPPSNMTIESVESTNKQGSITSFGWLPHKFQNELAARKCYAFQ